MRRATVWFVILAAALVGCTGNDSAQQAASSQPAASDSVQQAAGPDSAAPSPAVAPAAPASVPQPADAAASDPSSPAIVPPPQGEIEQLEEFSYKSVSERMKSMQAEPIQRTADSNRRGGGIYSEVQRFADPAAGLVVVSTNRRETAIQQAEKTGPNGETLEVVELGDYTYWEFRQEQPRYVGAFAANVRGRAGTWMKHFDNGRIRVRGTYMNDQRHGEFIVYNEEGRRVWRGNYEEGRLTLGENFSGQPAAEGELAALEGHLNGISQMTFSPDGSLLATSGYHPAQTKTSSRSFTAALPDFDVRLWDTANWQLQATLSHAAPAVQLCFAPDGKTLLTAPHSDGNVLLWDAASGAKLAEFQPTQLTLPHLGRSPVGVARVLFSSSGRLLAAFLPEGVKVWEAHTGRELYVLPSTEDIKNSTAKLYFQYKSMAFSDDESVVGVMAGGYALRLFDSATGALLEERKELRADIGYFPLFAKGKLVLGRDQPKGFTHFLSLRSGECRIVGEQPTFDRTQPRHYWYSSDGGELFELHADRKQISRAVLWDLVTSQPKYVLDLADAGPPLDAAAILPGGNFWVGREASEPNQNGATNYHLWSVAAGKPTASWQHAPLPLGDMAVSNGISPWGDIAALADPQSPAFRVLNLSDQSEKTIVAHESPVGAVALSPDGRLLASGGRDTVIRIWDMATIAPGSYQPAPRPAPAPRQTAAFELGAAPPGQASSAPRTWSDKTGQFRIEAEFLGVSGGKAQLKKLDGAEISVPLTGLSQEDQVWIRDELRARRAAEKKK